MLRFQTDVKVVGEHDEPIWTNMNDMNEVFANKGFWELGTKIEAFLGFGPSAARIGIGGIGGKTW